MAGNASYAVSACDLEARRLLNLQKTREHRDEAIKRTTRKIDAPLSLSSPRETFELLWRVEAQIAEIWERLLGVCNVGRKDNFFELGGHSLLAIDVSAELRRVFSAEVDLHWFFDSPTVEKLAGAITRR